MPIALDASLVRRRFTDPVTLCERLGLDYRREGGGLKILCPWHQEQNPDCSVTLGPDGTVRIHCFSCQAGGDALTLIAACKGLDVRSDFRKVLQIAAEMVGEDALPTRDPPHRSAPRLVAPQDKQRPDPDEVAALWGCCQPPTLRADDLATRGLAAAELEQLDLVRVLPEIGSLPRWATFRRKGWIASGHHYIVPMYGATGEMESLHARSLGGPDPKALSPAGCLLSGLVMADAAGVELLRCGRAPGGGVVIAEGVPDFWTLATHWSDADPAAPAVLAVISGSWSEALANRIPDGAKVLVWTHTDRPKPAAAGQAARPGAGAAYAAHIRKTLRDRCDVRVIRQEIPAGAKKAPDANDLLRRGGRSAVQQVLDTALAGASTDSEDWQHRLLFDRTKDGVKIRKSLANVVTVLTEDPRWKGVLAYNSFKGRVEALKPPPWDVLDASSLGTAAGPWQDEDDSRAQAWLDRNFDLNVGGDVMAKAVRLASEHQRHWHPVKDYLHGIRWDRTERLPTLFAAYFGAEPSDYLAMVGQWWAISAVARVCSSASKVDTMIILEGAQGKKKSSALRALAVQREWFLETALPLGDKDSYEMLRGKWIVEFAELDSWRRADHRQLKSFLSKEQDTYRESYGRRSADHLRQCVFAGSTNEGQYIEDPTGGRRFWPVSCGDILLPELERDRDQIWAEAFDRFHRGQLWWPSTDAETQLCQLEQSDRYVGDPWESIVQRWLSDAMGADRIDIDHGRLTTSLVLERAIGVNPERMTKADETRVGTILHRCGFEIVRRQENGDRRRFYVRSTSP